MRSLEENKEIPLDQFQRIHTTANDHAILLRFAGKFESWLFDLKLPADLISNLQNLYIPLVNLLRQGNYLNLNRIPVIGISGSQGSGKSTFTELLAKLLREAYGYKVASFSIDDFYHTHFKREELSRNVHPLLITRGVPGTHDVELALKVFECLLNAGDLSRTLIPAFDKSVDDQKPIEEWTVFEGRPDIILFEGWCVGAIPEASEKLAIPVNDLEQEFDRQGLFRTFVNKQLSQNYKEWFSKIDFLILLKAPSFDLVYEWRLLQEKKLADKARSYSSEQKSLKIMSEEEVKFFISHYERITQHILEEMPERADLVLMIGNDHHFKAIRYNKFI